MFRGTRYVYLQSVWKRAYPWLTFILKELILSLHLANHCSTTMPVQEHIPTFLILKLIFHRNAQAVSAWCTPGNSAHTYVSLLHL